MQKNNLNLRICGVHLLNPYKTVVSHLKVPRKLLNDTHGCIEFLEVLVTFTGAILYSTLLVLLILHINTLPVGDYITPSSSSLCHCSGYWL